MKYRKLILAALAAVSTVGAAKVALARTIYDGNWSVLIITDRGSCDRAYRYGLSIDNGFVHYRGENSLNLSGRVDRSGRIYVRISRGDGQAQGSGRLSRSSGSGTWIGRSPQSTCTGRWIAERR